MDKYLYKNAMQEFRSYYNDKIAKFLDSSEQKRIANLETERTIAVLNSSPYGIFAYSLVILALCIMCGRSDLFAVVFVCLLILPVVNRVIYEYIKKKNREYSYENSEEVSTIDGYDEYLKKEFMLPFLKIFFSEPEWRKIGRYETVDFDDYINDKNLLPYSGTRLYLDSAGKIGYNFNSKIYDDYINARYKDINVEMIELSTYPCKFENIIGDFNVFIFASLFLMIIINLLSPVLLLFVMGISNKDTISGSQIPFWIAEIQFILSPWIYPVFYEIKKKHSFRGIIVTLTMNKKFNGTTTIIQKNSDDKVNFDISKYKQVNLESSNFSKHFDVYSDDQIEARYILTTSMMERIFNIKDAYNAKNIRLHFECGNVYIVINTGRDMFAMGNSEQKSRFYDFKKLVIELKSLIGLIEELKLNQKIGL